MQLILTSLQEPLAAAWKTYCGDLDFVQVQHGSIFEVQCDALVSPANSFGFMNGGIDLLYSQRLGWHVQERLQEAIRQQHHGELLIGAAQIVETDHPDFPFMIAAPTMRYPMMITETANPYLAARAVFLNWRFGFFPTGRYAGQPVSTIIRTIAMPGLRTGVGCVAPDACARQVRAAIDDILLEGFRFPKSWGQVMQRHEEYIGKPLQDQ
ncbi:MAG: macro domain-containing protein [Blastocatellia bacterium]|nr:macro domain-containing protein [Blastocatellia bacterium]